MQTGPTVVTRTCTNTINRISLTTGIIQLLPLVIYRGQLNDNNLACVFFHQNQLLTLIFQNYQKTFELLNRPTQNLKEKQDSGKKKRRF